MRFETKRLVSSWNSPAGTACRVLTARIRRGTIAVDEWSGRGIGDADAGHVALKMGDERATLAVSNPALLCFIRLCSCFSMGAFSPLLPEIGRAGELADWQLGVVAGALGFARMAAAVPAGWLAGRYLGT